MKKITIAVAFLFCMSLVALAQKAQTFSGEIMDSACAMGGSHVTMLKSHGMAGKENDPAAKAACTNECVKNGANLVLFQAKGKKVYQLDDASKATAYAGQNVKITGTLDAKTNTIHVQNVAKG